MIKKLLGAGGTVGAGDEAYFASLGSSNQTANGSSYNWSIGTVTPYARLWFVGSFVKASSGTGLSSASITVNGTAATKVYEVQDGGSYGKHVHFFYWDNDSSTSVTGSTSMSISTYGYGVAFYETTGYSATPYDTANYIGTTGSVPLTCPVGGAVLFGYSTQNGTTTTVYSQPNIFTVTDVFGFDTNSNEYVQAGYIDPVDTTSAITNLFTSGAGTNPNTAAISLEKE